MHDDSAQGEAFFKCDYCHAPWSEDRPMVEGHRGSLICAPCLTVAYVDVQQDALEPLEADQTCALCLEYKERVWKSPVTGAAACPTCVKRSAGILHKDDDYDWRKPEA